MPEPSGRGRRGAVGRGVVPGHDGVRERSPLRILLAIALLAAGLGLMMVALFGRTSEEERIRQQLERLERVAAIRPGDNVVTRSLRLKGELADLFEKDASVHIAETGAETHGRDELVALAAQADAAVDSLDVHFKGLEVIVAGTEVTARATGTVVVDATRPGQQLERGERRITFDLLNGDRGWRISGVRVAAPEAAE